MKKLFLLPAVALLITGCSKPAEEPKSEPLGKEIADKIRAPIEQTKAITEKIQKAHESPPME